MIVILLLGVLCWCGYFLITKQLIEDELRKERKKTDDNIATKQRKLYAETMRALEEEENKRFIPTNFRL